MIWTAGGIDGRVDGRVIGRRVKLLIESGRDVFCLFKGRGLVMAIISDGI